MNAVIRAYKQLFLFQVINIYFAKIFILFDEILIDKKIFT